MQGPEAVRRWDDFDDRIPAAAWRRRLCRADRLRDLLRPHLNGHDMSFDHALGGLAVLILLAYLGYALLKPEKFQ